MKKTAMILVSVLAGTVMAATGVEINAPPYPPQKWQLTITFSFSRDIFLQFLDDKPKNPECVMPESLNLWMLGDAAIRGSSFHPVVTHRTGKNGFGSFGSEALSFVPQSDQAGIYSNACRVLRAFSYAESFAFTNYDASGIDLTVDLQVNGRSLSVKYDKLQRNQILPGGVADLLALMRRNLPPSYDRLFDSLLVPRLPPLEGKEASQYLKCELHNEWMKIGDIPIVYGLLMRDEASQKAEKQIFPNANTSTAGGCVSSPDSPKEEKTLYCETCRHSQKAWLKKGKTH